MGTVLTQAGGSGIFNAKFKTANIQTYAMVKIQFLNSQVDDVIKCDPDNAQFDEKYHSTALIRHAVSNPVDMRTEDLKNK